MANKYVDARSGNDSNTGADWANAKKTLGAMYTAASSGDTIYCVGVFYETVNLSAAKTITFTAVGFAVLDGKSILNHGVYVSAAYQFTFNGFTIRNYTGNGVYWYFYGGGAGLETYLTDCIIENCAGAAAYIYRIAGLPHLLRCLIRNCTYGLCSYYYSNEQGGFHTISCTFDGLSYGMYLANGGGAANWSCLKTIFTNNVYHIYAQAGAGGAIGGLWDYNCYDFNTGKCSYLGLDKTTLPSWRTATGRDAGAIDDDPEYVDRTKNVYYLKGSSPAIIAGAILGAYNSLLSDGASSNYNTLVWDNPITLTNVEQDANGNYVLSSGYTEGVVEWEFDFVVPRSITKIDLIHDYAGLGAGVGGGPNGILDYDESDTLPETWEYRIDTSPDGVSWDGYQTLDLFNNVALTGVQKLRIEATLRSDA